MTENHALVIPIMLSALIANAASKTVCPDGIYHALSKRFLSKAGHSSVPPDAVGPA